MSIKNSYWILGTLFLLVLHTSLMPQSVQTVQEKNPQPISFTSTKGLSLQILPQEGSGLCSSELMILTPYKGMYPGISQIAYENLFNPALTDGHNSLLSALKRIGGDFSIINGGDHLRIRVTFLPQRLNAFIQFVQKLFTFQDFSQARFNSSIRYYGSRFRRAQGWEVRLIHHIAYRHLFPNHTLGSALVTRDTLNRARLAHVVTFFGQNFRLAHTTLVIKGDVKPYFAFGLVEKTFNNFNRSDKPIAFAQPAVNSEKRFIIFHTGRGSPTRIYWFKAIPPIKDPNHLPALVAEKILFGVPSGSIFLNASAAGIGNLKIESEIQDHCELSVVCNTISRISVSDLSRFFTLARSERRKLGYRPLERKEYLYAINFLFGRFKVNSGNFTNDLRLKSLQQICGVEPDHSKISTKNFSRLFQQVSINQVSKFIHTFPRDRRNGESKGILAEVIVITGDGPTISREIQQFNPTVFQQSW